MASKKDKLDSMPAESVQYVEIDSAPPSVGDFIAQHKAPFIAGGAGLLVAIAGLITGLVLHGKKKKAAEAEAVAQPADQ